MEEIYEVIPLLSALVNIAIGIYVVARDPRRTVNRLFGCIAGLLALWSMTEFVSRAVGTRSAAVAANMTTAVGWTFVGAVFVHFCMAFAGWPAKRQRKYLPFAYGLSLAVLCVTWFTDMVIKGYKLSQGPGQGYRDVGGVLRVPAELVVIVLFAAGVVILLSLRRNTESITERSNAGYVIIAVMIPLVTAFVTDIILPALDKPARVSSAVSFPFMALIIAYAVTRHDLMTSGASSIGVAIIESINEAVLITDYAGMIETANPAAIELTGYKEAELVGTNVERLFIEYPPGTPFAQRAEGAQWLLLLSEAGEPIPVTRSTGIVKRRSGKQLGSVVVLHDMREALHLMELERTAIAASEAARAERQRSEVLERTQEELREHGAFLQGVIDNLAEPVFIKNRELEYIYVNQALLELLGIEREDILGKTAQDVYPPELATEFVRADFEAFGMNQLVEIEDVELQVSEDVSRTVRILKAPIVDESTGREYMIGVISDITAQKQLDDARLDFIRIAAHELKTPMTSLKLGVELLARETRGSLDDEQQRWLDILSLSLQRLNQLARNLLDLASLDAGLLTMETEEVFLRPFMEESKYIFEVQLMEKGLTCEIECPDDISTAWVDPNRMSQVLYNLVSNAIKFTEEGGIRLIARDNGDGMLELCVSDTGLGIQPTYRQAIFSRFSKGGGAERAREGTGLGLSIAKAIVEAHGGKIWVDSTPGKGSNFYFTIRKPPANMV